MFIQFCEIITEQTIIIEIEILQLLHRVIIGWTNYDDAASNISI